MAKKVEELENIVLKKKERLDVFEQIYQRINTNVPSPYSIDLCIH